MKSKYKCSLVELWFVFFISTISIKYFKSNRTKAEEEINRCYHLFLSKISRITERFISNNRELIVEQTSNIIINPDIQNTADYSTDSIVKTKKAIAEADKKAKAKDSEEKEKQYKKDLLKTYTNELTEYINALHYKCTSKSNKYFASGIKKNAHALDNLMNPFNEYSFHIEDYSILINEGEK